MARIRAPIARLTDHSLSITYTHTHSITYRGYMHAHGHEGKRGINKWYPYHGINGIVSIEYHDFEVFMHHFGAW